MSTNATLPIEVWVIEFRQNIDGIVECGVQTVRSSR